MRYLRRDTLAEIDLVLNAPDNPSCPSCKHYNAMLAEHDRSLADKGCTLLRCRDCGFEVTKCPEPDIDAFAKELIENASDEAIRDALVHLRYVRGASFCTAAEFAGFEADLAAAREILHCSSYTAELFSYFAGYIDGGGRGSAALARVAAERGF